MAMNEHRTASILQRVPVILAVTAASYGLPLQSKPQRPQRDRHGAAGMAAASAFGGPVPANTKTPRVGRLCIGGNGGIRTLDEALHPILP